MDKRTAIQLVRESLAILSLKDSDEGGQLYVGGICWRLIDVLNEYLKPQLAPVEGQHAMDRQFQSYLCEFLGGLGRRTVTESEIVHHFLVTGFPIDVDQPGCSLKISATMMRIGWIKTRDPVTRAYFYEAPVTYWVGGDGETTG